MAERKILDKKQILDKEKILDDRTKIIEQNKTEQEKLSNADRDLRKSIYKVEVLFRDKNIQFDESSIVEFYSLKDDALRKSMTILKNMDKLISRINFNIFKQKLFGQNLARMNSENNEFNTLLANGLETLTFLKTQFDKLYDKLYTELGDIQLPSPSSSPTQSPSSSPTQSPSSSPNQSPSSSPRVHIGSLDESAYTSGGKQTKHRKQTKLRQRKISKKYKHKYTKRRH